MYTPKHPVYLLSMWVDTNGALPSQQIPVESVESLDEPPLVVHVDGSLRPLPPLPALALAAGQYVVIARFYLSSNSVHQSVEDRPIYSAVDD